MTPYYEDERATVYHGDSLEVMDTLAAGSLDLVVTDPPYIIGAVSAGSLGSKSGGWADMMNSAMWFGAWYRKAGRLLRHDGAMWSFCNWRSLPVVMRAAMDAEMAITSTMVWDKEWIGPGGSQGLRPAHELCCLFAKPDFAIPDRGVPDVWRHKTGGFKPNGHPAEKPVDLVVPQPDRETARHRAAMRADVLIATGLADLDFAKWQAERERDVRNTQ